MQNQSQEILQSDEIDLKELMIGLWQGKWWVILSMLISLVMALVYLFNMTPDYKGTIQLRPLNNIETLIYQNLNEVETVQIDHSFLAESFYDLLTSKELLVSNMLALDYVAKEANESDEKYLQRVHQVASGNFLYDYKVQAQAQAQAQEQDRVDRTLLDLTITTQKPNLATVLLNNTFEQISDQIKNALGASIRQDINAKKTARTRILNQLKQEQSFVKKLHLDELNNRQFQLEQQIKIARTIDIPIDVSVISSQKPSANTNFNYTQQIGGAPHYTQGYLALEEALKSLEKQRLIQPFNDAWQSLEKEIFDLETEVSIVNIEQAYVTTPLNSAYEGNEAFRAVVYNLNNLQFKSTTKPLLIIFLALIVGGMVGVVLLVLRNILSVTDK